MSAIKAIFKKELLQLKRDPRLIGFIVFMPILLLILFGYALKLEPEDVKMAYLDEDSSYFTNLIKTNIWMEGYFELYEVDSKAEIIEEIRSGRAKAGLYIAKDFSKRLSENDQPHLQFYVDGTMPSLTTAMKNKSSSITDDTVTGNMYFLDADSKNVVIAKEPFIMDTEVLFNPDEIETWFFLPGIVGVLIMQVALILAGISVVREKESNTLEQLIVTPMSKSQFVIGKTLPYIIISLFEFIFILFLGWAVFELPVPPASYGYLLLLALDYVGAMIAMGLFISMISQTQQQAMFMAVFIMIPSILLSGLIFPIEAMPHFIQPVSYLLPFTYFVEIIRGLLIKGTLIADLAVDYLALFGYMTLFTVLSIWRFKKYLN